MKNRPRQPHFRIIAGQYRGTQLLIPSSSITRPAKDNVKEAIFNKLSWLTKADGSPLLSQTVVMDIFAGSGSMGFEALSRGAAKVIMVDDNHKAMEVIKSNAARLGRGAEAKLHLMRCDVTQALKQSTRHQKADLVFVDPPYFKNLVPPTLRLLTDHDWLHAHSIVVTEMDVSEPFSCPTPYTLLGERCYGRLIIRYLCLYAPSPQTL